jgi:tetratricopeptide (TPR) repeat protein
MDSAVLDEVRSAANRGIQALKERRPEQASADFAGALAAVANVPEAAGRRDETTALAQLFSRAGFADLAFLAYEDAIYLDKQLGLKPQLGLDLLEAGNATSQLGNEAEAEGYYRDALDILVAAKRFANAASASTNLGGSLANRGLVAEGIALLQQSLEYLAQAPFPDTELQTRFGLLQLYEHVGYDVDRSVDNAAQLFARFYETFRPEQREVAETAVRQLIDRYCAAHPEVDCQTWKAATFPQL